MSSGKLLTISIPTWNRSSLLRELLSELTNEISTNQLEQEIEIVVSNNNSGDETETVVNSFREKFPFINYNRNATNIGAKSNVLKSMYLARSKFVLFIGDDDKIRKGALSQLLNELRSNEDTGVLIDTSLSKYGPEVGEITLEGLLEKYYWYIGNAGFFVIRSEYIQKYLDKYGYDYFNECWPQTQIMILALSKHKLVKCYLVNVGIHAESAHGDVMMYNSFYLWRTCYYELMISINSLSSQISYKGFLAAKSYLKRSITQQLFNILQCGLFVDTSDERKKTRRHIVSHLNLFSFYEKVVFIVVSIALWLPTFISRPLANGFIFLIRGKKGLNKKNEFVEKELRKRGKNQAIKAGEVRMLEFEKG